MKLHNGFSSHSIIHIKFRELWMIILLNEFSSIRYSVSHRFFVVFWRTKKMFNNIDFKWNFVPFIFKQSISRLGIFYEFSSFDDYLYTNHSFIWIFSTDFNIFEFQIIFHFAISQFFYYSSEKKKLFKVSYPRKSSFFAIIHPLINIDPEICLWKE